MINEQDIQKLEESYNELDLDISLMRKRGKDTNILEILLLNIKPKMKMVKTSLEKHDFEIAKRELEHIRKELEHVKKGNLPVDMINLIYEANNAVYEKKIKKAEEKYVIIKKFYDQCEDEMLKRIMYEASIDLYTKITKLKEEQERETTNKKNES